MIGKNNLIAIAKILNKNMYSSDGEFGSELFMDLVVFFKSVNPNFDEVKFREAVFKNK